MTWSIDPSAARAVISEARAETATLDSAATTTSDRYADAIAAVRAPRTAQALTNLAADPFLVSLAALRRRVVEVTDTAGAVIDLYVAGDLEMAATTQAAMRGAER